MGVGRPFPSRRLSFGFLSIFILCLTGLTFGASVFLRNGVVLEGEVLNTDGSNLVVATSFGTTYVPLANVGTIVFKPTILPPLSFSEVSIVDKTFEGSVIEIKRDMVRIRTWFGQIIVRNLSLLNYAGFVEPSFASRVKRRDVINCELLFSGRYAIMLTNGERIEFSEFKFVEGFIHFVERQGVEYFVSPEYIDQFYISYEIAAREGYDVLVTRTGRKLYGKVRRVPPNFYEVTTVWGVERIPQENVAFSTFKEEKPAPSQVMIPTLGLDSLPLSAVELDKDGTGVIGVDKLPTVSGKPVRTIRLYEKEIIDPRTGIVFVFVPAGTFKMGASSGWGNVDADELPQRDVFVGSFYISKYPVTVGQYLNFLRSAQVSNVSQGKDISAVEIDFLGQRVRVSYTTSIWKVEQPITGISWQAAQAFCDWAGYQLPTEAQWEKAARGKDGRRYPWGNEFHFSFNDGTTEYSVYDFEQTDVSPYGAVNMFGYPAEFCRDYYDRDAYRKLPTQEPYNATGRTVVARLGAQAGRITDRISVNPNEERTDITFRVVIPAERLEQVLQTPLKNKMLGATLFTVNDSVKRNFGINVDGLYVAFVERGSPVESAGLSVGDVITSFDGRAVKSLDDLSKALSTKKVGDVVRLIIVRYGRSLELSVKLGDWRY